MKNALQYAKRTSWAKATSNIAKIKPIALAIIELRLSLKASDQSVRQSVENSINFSFKIP